MKLLLFFTLSVLWAARAMALDPVPLPAWKEHKDTPRAEELKQSAPSVDSRPASTMPAPKVSSPLSSPASKPAASALPEAKPSNPSRNNSATKPPLPLQGAPTPAQTVVQPPNKLTVPLSSPTVQPDTHPSVPSHTVRSGKGRGSPKPDALALDYVARPAVNTPPTFEPVHVTATALPNPRETSAGAVKTSPDPRKELVDTTAPVLNDSSPKKARPNGTPLPSAVVAEYADKKGRASAQGQASHASKKPLHKQEARVLLSAKSRRHLEEMNKMLDKELFE